LKLLVGLGNPGREYRNTRHNVGWWVVDHLADVWHLEGWKKDHDALITTGTVRGTRVRLMKPQTYMNLSGQALRPYTRRPFWSPKTDLLVVVDDVALEVGRYRLRARGSAGGHNGLKSVEAGLGTQEYPRLRIGIRPADERRATGPLRDFVTSDFGKGDRDEILGLLPTLTTVIESWLFDGIDKAMSLHNNV
jgi:PTH1 family peptidyl-tRNA hydrolase